MLNEKNYRKNTNPTILQRAFTLPGLIIDGFVTVTKFAWRNKFKLGLLVFAGVALLKKEENIANTNDKALLSPDKASCPNELSSTVMAMNLLQQCPEPFPKIPVTTIEEEMKLLSDTFILDKISLDQEMAGKLTSEQQLKVKQQVLQLIKNIAINQKSPARINAVLNNKNFKIVIGDKFQEGHYGGTGLYRESEQTLFIRNPEKLQCDDIAVTLGHELHHAYVNVLRTQGEPSLIGRLRGDDNTEPFTNATEQGRLAKAIQEGNGRVTGKLKELHQKFLAKNLTPDEQKEYKGYIAVLQNYVPRCVAQTIPVPPQNKKATKKAIRKAGGITNPQTGVRIFASRVEDYDKNTLVVWGRLVNDADADKVLAFIRDTEHWMRTNQERYQMVQKTSDKESFGKTLTTEDDAERNADSQEILQRFYPELVGYHKEFCERIVNEQYSQSTQRSRLCS